MVKLQLGHIIFNNNWKKMPLMGPSLTYDLNITGTIKSLIL